MHDRHLGLGMIQTVIQTNGMMIMQSVVRCCNRIYAIFIGEIDGFVELERYECGLLGASIFFPIERSQDALKKFQR